jgi:ribonuclease P protein component
MSTLFARAGGEMSLVFSRLLKYSLVHETNVSAKKEKASRCTRFFGPYGYQGGPQDAGPPQAERTQEARRLGQCESALQPPMPKKNRLSGPEIRRIGSTRRRHGSFFSVSIASSPSGRVQCACVVSKKVSPLAVRRNLIKRRCREALRKHLPTLSPAIYMFHAKKEALGASYADISADIASLAKKV